jgi:sugar transferase (PEP-CTERM/EpsH1 system associated)
MLVSRFPYPPDRGDRLTLYNLMKLFSTRHEVTLFSLTDGSETPEALERVAEVCAHVETVRLSRTRSWAQAWLGLVRLEPSQNTYYHSGAMHALLRRRVTPENFDVVFTHGYRMAPYAISLRHPGQLMYLGDSAGIMYRRELSFVPWWKRPGLAWELWRVERYEVLSSRHFVENWALSAVDQQDLTRLGCHNVVLVPHGLDERLYDVEPQRPNEPRVVFLGNLSVPHNIDGAVFSAREVWPLVRARVPNATFVVAGAGPTPEVLRLAELPGVEVTGHVPDLRDVWKTSHAMLAPLRFSAGIQNKLLEAMAAGVPVVTTPPAAQAIGAQPGENVLVSETPQGLAQAVIDILSDPGGAARRARAAREHVRRNYNWTTILERLEHVGRIARETRGITSSGTAGSAGRARA